MNRSLSRPSQHLRRFSEPFQTALDARLCIRRPLTAVLVPVVRAHNDYGQLLVVHLPDLVRTGEHHVRALLLSGLPAGFPAVGQQAAGYPAPTQVMVDPYDDAFTEPVKVIGRLLSKEEAEQEEKHGNYVTEVEGGYRRIVAAPKPQGIIEIDSIKALSDQGQVVIACGGGGIPVLAQGVELHGASAVIEKDYASGRMAELLNADALMILTSVEHVCVGYNTDQEVPLEHISVEDAQQYINSGQFEPNTMLPKIEAGVSFLEKGNGRKVIITSIDKALEGYLGKTGTIIE